MAERERWVHDRMFRLLPSHPCCAPKVQHPTFFCSPADLLTESQQGDGVGGVWWGGGGHGKAGVGHTIISISPDCVFLSFQLPRLTAIQKY